jgi:hypothetical protein
LKATASAVERFGLKFVPVELRNPPYDYKTALKTASPATDDALMCMPSPYFFHDTPQLDA